MGPETKNDCAGEGQEQITILHCKAQLAARACIDRNLLYVLCKFYLE
jgi:hypothetical protein